MAVLMHSHHEGPLFEWSHDPKERYDYIVECKPERERAIRMALFAVIPDEVARGYFPSVKAWASVKAWGDKAWGACDWRAMHRDLCWPWCPGQQIFAKGYDLGEVSGWR